MPPFISRMGFSRGGGGGRLFSPLPLVLLFFPINTSIFPFHSFTCNLIFFAANAPPPPSPPKINIYILYIYILYMLYGPSINY